MSLSLSVLTFRCIRGDGIGLSLLMVMLQAYVWSPSLEKHLLDHLVDHKTCYLMSAQERQALNCDPVFLFSNYGDGFLTAFHVYRQVTLDIDHNLQLFCASGEKKNATKMNTTFYFRRMFQIGDE